MIPHGQESEDASAAVVHHGDEDGSGGTRRGQQCPDVMEVPRSPVSNEIGGMYRRPRGWWRWCRRCRLRRLLETRSVRPESTESCRRRGWAAPIEGASRQGVHEVVSDTSFPESV